MRWRSTREDVQEALGDKDKEDLKEWQSNTSTRRRVELSCAVALPKRPKLITPFLLSWFGWDKRYWTCTIMLMSFIVKNIRGSISKRTWVLVRIVLGQSEFHVNCHLVAIYDKCALAMPKELKFISPLLLV